MEKKLTTDLFSQPDLHTGGDIYYLDNSCKTPFTGIVMDYFKGKLSWEFEVTDGYQQGKERVYYDDTGELMTENDMDHNTICGLQKVFYKSGKIKSKSIALRNLHVDIITYDEDGNIINRQTISEDDPIFGSRIDWAKIAEYRTKYNFPL